MENVTKNLTLTYRKGSRRSQRRPAYSPGYTVKWEGILLLMVILACIIASANIGLGLPVAEPGVSMGLGLVLGIAVVKQRSRRRRLFGHMLATGIALLVTWLQANVAFFNISPEELAQSISGWIGLVPGGGMEENSTLVCFALLLFALALAYGSIWCMTRAGFLWPMLVAHTALLLYLLFPFWNTGIVVIITIFVLSSLLLALHVHLHVSIGAGIRSGIEYPAHVKKVMTRLGAIIAIGILLLAWFLPAGSMDSTTANFWNNVQQRLSDLFSNQQGTPLEVAYPFDDTLALGISPRLSSAVVATVQSSANQVYLEARWYDIYTGADWINGVTNLQSYPAQYSVPSQTLMTAPLSQTITLVTSTKEDYLLGAPGISAVSLPANVLTDVWNREPIAWLPQHQVLAAGTHYTVTSDVSVADAAMLRNVPQPTEALVQSAPKANESASIGMDLNSGLFPFLQLPYNMDIRVTNLATQITAGMPTMYDKVMALESYLRTHYIYDLSVKVPSGQEAVSWFLFNSGNRGYCTDFATAMAIMARSVGIPARVVSGYAPGTYDSRLNQQIIHGTDAHSWT